MIDILCEKYKIVAATTGPVTTNGGVTGNYVSVKTCNYVWLLLSFIQAVSHATVTTFREATAVAGTAVQTLANAMEIWSNILGTAASDTFIRRTAATGYTLGAGTFSEQVLVGFDPARLSDGFDVVGFVITTSGQATNFVSGLWFLDTRYPQATPPVAITD